MTTIKVVSRKTGLRSPAPVTGRSKALLLLWFILIVNIRPLSVCLGLLFIWFRIALWPSAGKELSSWLSARAVFILCRLNCTCSFPFGVWGRMWKCNCIGSWSLPFHLLLFRLSDENYLRSISSEYQSRHSSNQNQRSYCGSNGNSDRFTWKFDWAVITVRVHV